VGFEPTACCLRNIGALFHSVPVRSPSPMEPRTPRFARLYLSRFVPLGSPCLLAVLLADHLKPLRYSVAALHPSTWLSSEQCC
jgi:hypothetical protein